MDTALPSPLAPPTIAAWLALVVGAWLALIPWGPQHGEVQATVIHPGPVVIPADRHGQYTTEGQIDGVPARLLVDTGAADVVIPTALAERAGLPLGEAIRYRSVNGVVMGRRTHITALRIGPLELRNVPATVVEGTADEVLLGMSALRHLQWVQWRGRLTLTAP